MTAAEASSSTGVSSGEKVKLGLIYGGIAVTTVLAFIASVIIGQISVPLAGLGIVSYIFGLRHAVDADHIAAIDNTTRKLLQEGKRPLTVGTWFSLGHSTIVFGLAVAIIFAANAVNSAIPAIQQVGSVLGTLISGTFLILIGLVNLPRRGRDLPHLPAAQARPAQRARARRPARQARFHEPLLRAALSGHRTAEPDVPGRACSSASASTPRARYSSWRLPR